MPAAYYERPIGIGTGKAADVAQPVSIPILVVGAADEDEADACVEADAPETRGSRVRDSWQLTEIVEGNVWEGTVTYVPESQQTLVPPETGESFFTFDTQGATSRVFVGDERSVTWADGSTSGSFGGAIGIAKPGDAPEGVDIIIPQFHFSVTRYVNAEDMSEAYVESLYTLTGKVNNATLDMNVDGVAFEFQAGELLFLGATGGKRRTANDWEIIYNFAASPNVTNLRVGPGGSGGITVPQKDGWDLVWTQFDMTTTDNKFVSRLKAAVVNRVYLRADLSALNIPDGS